MLLWRLFGGATMALKGEIMRRWLAVVGALVLAVAACGSGRSPTATDTTISGPTTTPTPSVATTSTPSSSTAVNSTQPSTTLPAPTSTTTAPAPSAPTSTAPIAATHYGPPRDLGEARPADINNVGVIVGTLGGVSGAGDEGTVGQDDAQAVWWPTPSSAPQPLGVAPGTLSFGVAVGDDGRIVAQVGHPESPQGAIVVDTSTGTTVTMPLPYGDRPQPWAMNDRGEVLVNTGFNQEDGRDEGIVWDSVSGRVDSPAGLAGQWFILHDIDNRGDVVGHAGTWGEPFFWDRTTGEVHFLDLGDAMMGFALGINDRGQIVGEIRFELEEPAYTVLWDDYTAAPQMLVDFKADPADINNRGQIAGVQGFGADAYRCVFDPGTGEIVPVPSVEFVSAMNDLGQIVGASDGHAALWLPN